MSRQDVIDRATLVGNLRIEQLLIKGFWTYVFLQRRDGDGTPLKTSSGDIVHFFQKEDAVKWAEGHCSPSPNDAFDKCIDVDSWDSWRKLED
jgi:hypothetical protein